ncbi:MAG: HisA/HisF-related TIM barrel protein [Cyclobacteriaceae bacterium]|jgi:cyclase
MKRVRVIPVIMINSGRAVVTQKFSKPIYVGDPINSIKILNDKEVDELVILDITDKKVQKKPDFDLIEKMASESFMPLAYGGHVTEIADAEILLKCGIEKISFNQALFTHPDLVKELSYRVGKQSIVASIDVNKNFLGHYQIKTKNGTETVGTDIEKILKSVLELGVGEIFLNTIYRDGSMAGYDEKIVKRVTNAVDVPVIACGGAAGIADFLKVVKEGGASAVAAGAMFFFKGGFNSVLVNYPDQKKLLSEFYTHLE